MGNELHIKAEQARENGDFLESLVLCDEATVEYVKEGNTQKLAEVQASRALSFRHLAAQTENKNFLILAKYAAKAGIKIIGKSDNKNGIALPLYTLAKVLIDLEKFDKAQEKIKEALEAGDETINQATIAEMKTRLAALEYRLGVDGAESAFSSALSELESEDIDEYTKKVWISGAYLHMAEAKLARQENADELLAKAAEIINTDDRLKIRHDQLTKLQNS